MVKGLSSPEFSAFSACVTLSSGDARLPDWLSTLPRQPTVYATLGTTFNRSPDTFQAILAALSAAPVSPGS